MTKFNTNVCGELFKIEGARQVVSKVINKEDVELKLTAPGNIQN